MVINFMLISSVKCAKRWVDANLSQSFLLIYYDRKYYLQVYLNNCAYKFVENQMIDYLDGNLFETDGD